MDGPGPDHKAWILSSEVMFLSMFAKFRGPGNKSVRDLSWVLQSTGYRVIFPVRFMASTNQLCI